MVKVSTQAPDVFTAEWLGVEDLCAEDETHVRLRHGDIAFDVRGSFSSIGGYETLVLEANDERVFELTPRSMQWTDLREKRAKEKRHEEDREWLLSRCPPQYLNARPFIRWMRDLYRDGRAHGADLASAFAFFFGCAPGASEWTQFAQGVAFHNASSPGATAFVSAIADGATCGADGHDATRPVLHHALLCGWLKQGACEPAPWQNNELTKRSVDSFVYEPTEKSEWRGAPAWLDDIVHFMPPRAAEATR